jgi:hypothetical protein
MQIKMVGHMQPSPPILTATILRPISSAEVMSSFSLDLWVGHSLLNNNYSDCFPTTKEGTQLCPSRAQQNEHHSKEPIVKFPMFGNTN